MRFFNTLLVIVSVLVVSRCNNDCLVKDENEEKPNGCIDFSITSGTGCAWMCNYCATQLGTNNYYFTDGVCSYEEGQGCVGNPIAGKTYTCCMV
jgi:hypothetical protein